MMERPIEDSFKSQGLRQQMVKELAARKVAGPEVLAAMSAVPRHLFMDTVLEHKAYEDRAYPIKCGQTISQPSTVAFQSQLLETQSGMKVLEVGTGSGYQTAVLCSMGLKVYTIERMKELYDDTKRLLGRLHYRANCFLGDGFVGLPEYGLFDRVLITCGAPFVPEALKEQIKVGGIMVIPVRFGEEMEMLRLDKVGPDEWRESRYGDFNFVPMLNQVDYGAL